MNRRFKRVMPAAGIGIGATLALSLVLRALNLDQLPRLLWFGLAWCAVLVATPLVWANRQSHRADEIVGLEAAYSYKPGVYSSCPNYGHDGRDGARRCTTPADDAYPEFPCNCPHPIHAGA